MNEQDNFEYDLLITRAKFHKKILEEKPTVSSSSGSSSSHRKTNYLVKTISCSKHKSADKDCGDCIIFPFQDKLPNGRLPSGKQVLGYLFYLNSQSKADGNQQASNHRHAAADVMNHWISCNIYTLCYKNVHKKLCNMSDTFETLKKYPAKKKGDTFMVKLRQFIKECEKLFDIKTFDEVRQKLQGKIWNVKETSLEVEFYKGQCKVPQV